MTIDFRTLDFFNEGIIKISRLNILELNKKALEFGMEKGKTLIECFTFHEIDKLVDSIIKKHDFKSETNIFFFKGKTRYCCINYIASENIIFISDKTEIELIRKVKSDFVTALSHELRTPLSVAKGNTQMLADFEDNPQHVEVVKKVQKSINKIENIINQLTMLSMAELGMYSLKIDMFDPTKVFEEVYSDLEPKIKNKNISIDFKCTAEYLKEDRFVIYTILRNLISNAVKYSNPDSTIEVRMDEKSIQVKDFGIGIKDEDKPRIFERFFRSPEAVKMAKGSGLGLAVVRYLCELSEYKIDFESKWMIGSTFRIFLKEHKHSRF